MEININDVVMIDIEWIKSNRELLTNKYHDYRHLSIPMNLVNKFIVDELREPTEDRPFRHVWARGAIIPYQSLIYIKTVNMPAIEIIEDKVLYRVVRVPRANIEINRHTYAKDGDVEFSWQEKIEIDGKYFDKHQIREALDALIVSGGLAVE